MDLRMSFHTRLDFTGMPPAGVPSTLKPGETIEIVYKLHAPDKVNLTCEYNSIAYGHWTALYRRDGRARLAHYPVRLELKDGEAAVQ